MSSLVLVPRLDTHSKRPPYVPGLHVLLMQHQPKAACTMQVLTHNQAYHSCLVKT